MTDIYKNALHSQKVELLREIESRFRAAYQVDLDTLNEFLIRNYEFSLKDFVAQEAPKNDPIMMAAGLHFMVAKMITPDGKCTDDHFDYKPDFENLTYIYNPPPWRKAENANIRP